MTVSSVPNRLGLDAFGAATPLIGNVLLYPRRVVLEVLKLAFSQADLFVPTTADGTALERNPFLLKFAADGSVAPDSRIVLTDFASDTLLKSEARPRVVVERSGGRFSARTGFAQRNALGAAGQKVDQRSDLYETGVVVRCVGRAKLESELLGLIVQMLVQMFSDEIRRKSDLFHLAPPEVGPTSTERFDSTIDQFVTTVSFSAVQTVQWVKSKINQTAVEDVCLSLAAIAL